jgi:dihydroneopterin aldolase
MSERKRDTIEIHGLSVWCHVGVPDEERAEEQELLIDLRVQPKQGWEGCADEIGATIDYDALATRVQEEAASRPRKLIETLANDIAACVLASGKVHKVGVKIRKFILQQTEFVAVEVERCDG